MLGARGATRSLPAVRPAPRLAARSRWKWYRGDVLAVEAEFDLKTHVQSGERGQRWVAFTHGPIALAQKVSSIPDDEPFDGRRPDEAEAMLVPSAHGSYWIAGPGITLMPYHLTCTDDSGPKTYFRCG